MAAALDEMRPGVAWPSRSPPASKRHVTQVLAKLAAANRTQAVTRARELGLLP